MHNVITIKNQIFGKEDYPPKKYTKNKQEGISWSKASDDELV